MHRKIAGLLALTGAVCALAAAARPESQQDPGEPCCGIVAIDQAKGIVTVKDKSGRFTFLATLANPKSAAGLRTGLAVGLSNETKTLILPAKAGRAKQNLGLSAVQFGGLTYPGAP